MTIVYRIWDNIERKYCTAYSRAYHDEEEWNTEDRARNSRIDGEYKDKERYKVHVFERREERIK